MKKVLFYTSLSCTTLLFIFLWTKISLNGYATDFYFFLGVLLLHLICFATDYKDIRINRRPLLNLFIAVVQIIGLTYFLLTEEWQAQKVYTPANTKHNLYASLSGWHKKAYIKRGQSTHCDGEFWETKVPYYFPVIEWEIRRNKCYRLGVHDRAIGFHEKLHSPVINAP